MKRRLLTATATLCLLLSACGPSGDSTPTPPQNPPVTNPKPTTPAPTVDTEKPTLDVKASSSNVTVLGPVTINPNVKDNVAVLYVQYYENDVLKFTATEAPYTATVSFPPKTQGTYRLRVVALDTSGNRAEQTITLTVDIPADVVLPVIALLTASTANVTTPTEVAFSASVSDNDAVRQVLFYDNDTLVATDTLAPYAASRSYSALNNGNHVIKAVAEDFGGNKSERSLNIVVNIEAGGSNPPGLTPPPPNNPGFPHGYKPPCYSPARIKGNIGSSGRIYHVPGGAYYDRTDAEVCYITEADAQADGFRRSSR